MSVKNYRQRFAATRSWRFLPQMFIRSTNVCATTKLSYEARNRQFVISWPSVLCPCKPLSLLYCRVIECRLCVAYFLFFLKRWKFFLIQFFFWVGFASFFKNFGRVMAGVVFNCACKLRWLIVFYLFVLML